MNTFNHTQLIDALVKTHCHYALKPRPNEDEIFNIIRSTLMIFVVELNGKVVHQEIVSDPPPPAHKAKEMALAVPAVVSKLNGGRYRRIVYAPKNGIALITVET